MLRRILGFRDQISTITDDVIAAAAKRNASVLLNAICDERLVFLQGLRTWSTFGNGWARRVREVRAVALAMASVAAPPKAKPPAPVVRVKALGWGAGIVAAIGATTQSLTGNPGLTIGVVIVAECSCSVSSLTSNRRNDMLGILLFAAAVFVIYAIVTHYAATDAGQPALKRVWAAVVAAAASVGAALSAWLAGLGNGKVSRTCEARGQS